MANVYYQSTVQLVFAPLHRQASIRPVFQEKLHKYIAGILMNQKHKPLAINSQYDHIHILLGMHPCSIPDLVRDLKSSSSTYLNENRFSPSKFQWQEGYGFFTYSLKDRPALIDYVNNQNEHHRKKTFQEEYEALMIELGIDFNEKYVFQYF